MTKQIIFLKNKPFPFRPPELNVQIWNKLSHLWKFSSDSVSARGVQNCSLAEHVVDELLFSTEWRHFHRKRVRERFGLRKQRSSFLQAIDVLLFSEKKWQRRKRAWATITAMITREAKKGNTFRLAKQQLCTSITLFCTLLCRCTTTTWNFLNSPVFLLLLSIVGHCGCSSYLR